MAIITKSGQIALAQALLARPLYLAWGTGDGAWGAAPSESRDATALQHEVGRRLVTVATFAAPGGPIVVKNGAYSSTVTPTSAIYIKVEFDFADAGDQVIRELGLFVDGTVVSGQPIDRRYFLPSQVDSPGRLLMLENKAPIFRSPSNRERFEFVLEL